VYKKLLIIVRIKTYQAIQLFQFKQGRYKIMALSRSQMDTIKSLFQTVSLDDLNEIAEMYQLRRTWLNNQARRSFVVGESVSFKNSGRTITGVIKKINPKTVVVTVNRGGHSESWKVSASYLSKLVA